MTKTAADWIAKYYPVPANQCPDNDVTRCEHGLLKWEGLANIKKYGLVKEGQLLKRSDNEKTVFNTADCALCGKNRIFANCLKSCPIIAATGTECCGIPSPWMEWVENKKTAPMIAVLKKALEWAKDQVK
jgi:hypothetical protein